ncbi:MAG: S8 family serine peptidase, partial [Nitrosopumilaceae archaeon]|nr:S8 family serine peptidase [Nitrosopumilaceae archaeon]
MIKWILFLIIVLAGSSLFLLEFQFENQISLYVEKSGPFLGTSISKSQGIDGNGVIVAVIDTGVDFNHPDLFGFGPDGKVIGGHNFIESNKLPSDTNGHGTQVAGIIAADGKISGIAPKSKILAYKVSEDGEGVQSELIVRAIKKAIDDGVDVINISLGVNKTNSEIERAVNEALKKDIFVVTAAGNDGPKIGSIGSPGRNFGSITVGATYNNLTSSLVATLEVNEKSFTVIPMVGSKKLDEPITSEIIFAEYGRERDFEKLDAKDKIILVERGSDVEGEIVYFSTKEKNAARAGAKALIVYNNEPGIFLGELIHEFVESDYSPSIPVVSIDRQEGLEIKDMIKNENRGFLHLFFNPDFVAHFSSRGPVSPFHIKPDIVAPGAYINTTRPGGFYNFTSGTSYAAPHVSGAAALLIDKYPNINNNEIKSLLITTAEPVTNSLGEEFSIHDAGAGRLNIGKAINANLIIEPPNFVSVISSEQPTITKQLKLGAINGEIGDIEIDYEVPDFVKINHIIHEKNIELQISVTTQNYGEHEGK